MGIFPATSSCISWRRTSLESGEMGELGSASSKEDSI